MASRTFLTRSRRETWRRVRSAIVRRWGGACLAVLRCRLDVHGQPPAPPCLLVSNHISYVDIFVLAACAPGRFVSKAEIRGWPVVGWMCRSVDILFVDRGRRRDVSRVGALIDEALEAGDPVILFPEGTSTAGHEVAPLKPSLLAPAAARGLPVHWAVLRYETPPDERPAFLSVAWWGDMPLVPHAPDLLKLRRFDVELVFGEAPVRYSDRKELGRQLREHMAGGFRPMASQEEVTTARELHLDR